MNVLRLEEVAVHLTGTSEMQLHRDLRPSRRTKIGETNPADHHRQHQESIVWFRKVRDKDVVATFSISQHHRLEYPRSPVMADCRKLIKIRTMVD